MSVRAHPRAAARHQALHRRAVAGDPGRRPRGRRAACRPATSASPWAASRPSSSIDDRDGAEWNTAAVGPDQARLADELLAPAAATASRRAACCTTARASGIPASSCRAGRSRSTGAATASRCGATRRWSPPRAARRRHASRDAERFMRGADRAAGPRPRAAPCPAYEDPALFPAQGADSCRPTSTRPTTSSTTRMERARLARVFDRGLDMPAGYVLPIQRWQARGRAGWGSERWDTRRERLFLMPGDSPVGFRLPWASLPWVPPEPTGRTSCRSTRSPRTPPCPPDGRCCSERLARAAARRGAPTAAEELGAGAHRAGRRAARRPALRVHAAASTPPRNIVELVAAIEDTARRARHCRCISRATRRPPIRASTSSRSRPTRA